MNLLVIGLVGRRRVVEGTDVVSGVALFRQILLTIPTLVTGTHTCV